MIEPTITSGYPGATFNLLDANNNVVAGTVTFTELFEATAAIFRPSSPLAYGADLHDRRQSLDLQSRWHRPRVGHRRAIHDRRRARLARYGGAGDHVDGGAAVLAAIDRPRPEPAGDRRCDGCARREARRSVPRRRADRHEEAEFAGTLPRRDHGPRSRQRARTDRHRLRHHRQLRHDDDDDQHRAGYGGAGADRDGAERGRRRTATSDRRSGDRRRTRREGRDLRRYESRRGGDRARRSVPVRDSDDRPERRPAHAAHRRHRRRRQPVGSGASVRGDERHDGAGDHAGEPRHVHVRAWRADSVRRERDGRGRRRHDRVSARRRAEPTRHRSRRIDPRHDRPRARRARRDDRRDRYVGQRRDTSDRVHARTGPAGHDGASSREYRAHHARARDQRRRLDRRRRRRGGSRSEGRDRQWHDAGGRAGHGDVGRCVHDADRSGGRRHSQLRRHRCRGQSESGGRDGGADAADADVDCRHAFELHAESIADVAAARR